MIILSALYSFFSMRCYIFAVFLLMFVFGLFFKLVKL